MIQVIAHRGASKQAPENSLSAFRLAVQAGAFGIEMDIQLTQDKVPIVFHDKNTQRLTGHHNVIERSNWKVLSQLRINEKEPIPTLMQVLDWLKSQTCHAIFEIKKQKNISEYAAHLIVPMICEQLPTAQFTISSFYPSILRAISKKSPNVNTAWLLENKAFTLVPLRLFMKYSGINAIHIHRDLVTPAFLKRAKAVGLKIAVWVVNDREEMRALSMQPIDQLFSDTPEVAAHILMRG